jgi:hypothetical protein
MSLGLIFGLVALPLSCVTQGCRTIDQASLLQLACNVARTSVAYGVQVDCNRYPDHKAAWAAGRLALDKILQADNFDPAALRTALAALPLRELQGPQGALVIDTIITVFSAGTDTFLDIKKSPTLYAIGSAVRDGIEAGMKGFGGGTKAIARPVRASKRIAI